MALIGTLTSGITALKTFSKGLEVIGNNIANVNTTGYKSSSTSFADTFSNTLRSASSAAGNSAVQVGTGVQVAGISTNFTQGSLSSTGRGTDLGISGTGYFVVQDGTSGPKYATRDGSFHWDTSGNLVNSQGFNVLDTTGTKINVSNYATAASISIATDGTVTSFGSDGSSTAAGQIGLLKVPDESKLMKQGTNLFDYSNTGAVATDLGAPTVEGRGRIQSGTLELSNVDLTEQFSELITTQRSFQAGSRLITVSDTVLEDIVNLKR
jgi:flagellar hook protein FlgE